MRKFNQDGKNESPDSHISDTVLMLAADGELDLDEATRVRSHLEACWSCRVRMEKIENAIADVIDFRDALLKPHLPLPSGPRALFIARLHQLTESLRTPPLWQRMLERMAGLAAAPIISRRVWAPALALLLAFTLVVRVGLAPTVSATELLERAKVSQERSLQSVKRPVVYRKVRIQSKGRDVTAVLYHDTASDKTVQTNESAAAATADLEDRLHAARLSWSDPLSLNAFISWREALAERTDRVTRSRDGLLTLHTSTIQGPITEIDLTLRDIDYHPIAETLRFQDQNNIEISELAYSVMPFEAVDAAIFAPPLPPPAPVVMVPAPPPPGPSARELADAELEARLALHVAGADLGEQIDVANTNGKAVVISGLVDSSERKQDLLQALQGIPYTRTQLDTFEHADTTSDASEVQDSKPIIAVESAPPLQEQLESHFSDAASRTEFINVSLSEARSAMSTAWALRRLSERYSADLIPELSTGSQRALEALVRDHVEALQKDLRDLSTGLIPLLSDAAEIPNSCEIDSSSPEACSDGECGVTSASSAQTATDITDWHRGVDMAFSDAQRIHNDVAVLLAGAGNQDVDVKGVVRDLKTVLGRATRQLPDLDRQVSGRFLGATDVTVSSR